MRKLGKVLVFMISLFLFAPFILADTAITVRIWLFQGTFMEGQPGLKKAELMSFSTQPELSGLKTLVDGPEREFRAAVIDTLLDIRNLRAMDDLFLFDKTWNGERPTLQDTILGNQVAFRVDLSLKKVAPLQVAMRAVISKTKDGALREEKNRKKALRDAYEATLADNKMERVADEEFLLLIDDPVIIGVPFKDKAYFLVVHVTAKQPESARETFASAKAPSNPNLVVASRPIHTVLPFYPDELISQGFKGDIRLRLTIDEKGRVQNVEVLTHLHPYLDYSAAEAFRLWIFEPILRKGKPIRAAFDYDFTFDPEVYSRDMIRSVEPPATMAQPSQNGLQEILNGAAAYCRKLADAALFYICEETIKEIHHQLRPIREWRDSFLKYREYSNEDTVVSLWSVPVMDPSRSERNEYLCDYQLIRKGSKIDERRMIVRENGRKIADQKKLLEDSRYSVLMPIFAPIQILTQNRQSLFNYRILDEDKVRGQKAVVIEAIPKSGDADGVRSAKIWVDKESFQVYKCEIDGIPIEGYEDVLKDSALLNIKPIFQIKHEFRVEKKGILFPESTTVRVEYPVSRMARPVLKMKIDLSYKKFKFFTVDTGHEIIK